jgi:hypothetical protein
MVRNCAPENLEIPGLVLSDHPGMTTQGQAVQSDGLLARTLSFQIAHSMHLHLLPAPGR